MDVDNCHRCVEKFALEALGICREYLGQAGSKLCTIQMVLLRPYQACRLYSFSKTSQNMCYGK